MPPNWENHQARALGVKLMHLLAEQIDGKLTYVTEGGTVMQLTVPARRKKMETARVPLATTATQDN